MSFRLAQAEAGPAVPRIIERDLTTATLTKGAWLVVDGTGKYAEAGADPASVNAIAATAAGTDSSGFNILGKKEFPAGKMQGITVLGTTFRCKYVGTLPAVDGGNYGVVKDADNDWKTDFTDTVNTRVKLVGRLTNSPESLPEVLVQVLLSAAAQN